MGWYIKVGNMKDSRHRRERSLGFASPSTSANQRANRGSPPPLKGILRKTSRFDQTSKPPIVPGKEPTLAGDLSTSDAAEQRLEPVVIPISQDKLLLVAVGKAMETVREDLERQERERMEARKERMAAAMQALATMKMPGKDEDQSLVVLEDSGSETERGEVSSNRPSLRLAIQTYAPSQHQSDLLALVEANGTPRLSLLMQEKEVTGLYTQTQGGWKKLYGGKEAPAAVEPMQVSECYQVHNRDLAPISKKCLWRADVFTL